jgi:hypothetical protein
LGAKRARQAKSACGPVLYKWDSGYRIGLRT